ncbi:MAG: ATP-dependent DNA helicase RecG [Myxococcales bacterium]|nr:ATP-dependent DNA helicase RecG [Myxococcales bacterium]
MPSPKSDPRIASFKRLKDALRDPVHCARRNSYQRLNELKDLQALTQKALTEAHHLPSAFVRQLLTACQRFDSAAPNEKSAALEHFISLLQGEPDWLTERPRPSPAKSPTSSTTLWNQWSTQPLSVLKGVGQTTEQKLAANGFSDLSDLVLYFPRTHLFWTQAQSFQGLQPGDHVVTYGTVVRSGVRFGRGRRFEVLLQDDQANKLMLTFFQFQKKMMEERFTVGAVVTVCGEVQRFKQRLQMAHPKSAPGIVPHRFVGLMPIYPERGVLKKETIARLIHLALDALPQDLSDPLPEEIRKKQNLPSLQTALEDIHRPQVETPEQLVQLEKPRERFVFTELLCAQLALIQMQNRRGQQRGHRVDSTTHEASLQNLFAFDLTRAQQRALKEILTDMSQPSPMGRLLQGDVGAGKTAVAMGACLMVIKNNMQCAVMAPTEVLAEQHHHSFQKVFAKHGISIALLTSSTKTSKRREILQGLESGAIHLVVGTQSLLNDAILFHRLGLTIVDEQHRFGVAQRAKLRAKGLQSQAHINPHFLAMTATPIPRSLALTLYGDLELSIIDELPPGRVPIETRILDQDPMTHVLQAIREAYQRKEKCYVIYPLIEESEKIDLSNAVEGFKIFQKDLPDIPAGLLHGRMPISEKDAAIQVFKSGETHILVSTTVIEVGVDIPEATLMVIMNAERFGLSQLHQLRGRVGRSALASQCLLVPGENGSHGKAAQRMEVLTQTNDGFVIAQEDLNLRGPGDFLGTRQAGLPSFAFADPIKDAQILSEARAWARVILKADPHLQLPRHLDLVTLMNNMNLEQLVLTEAG